MSLIGNIKTLFEDKEKTSPVFPITKIKAVSDDNGVGLDAILNTVVYSEEYNGDVATVALNADTLGGKTVDDFAQAPLRKSITILASGWSDSAPYTQTVSVGSITIDDAPHISPVYSDDLTIAISQKEAWGMVSRAKTDNNTITFICFEEKPAVDIDVQIEVIR